MTGLADENLATTFSFLSVSSLLQVSQTCSCFRYVSRADRLWLPAGTRHWRFGSLPSNTEVFLPGKRDMVSASSLADAEMAPLSDSAAAFAFFLKRCRQESQVAILASQQHCALLSGGVAVSGDFQPGAVVRVDGLSAAGQYNGHIGVIGPDGHNCSEADRLPVILPPSMKTLSVRANNLTAIGPALTSKEVERQVLMIGANSIDALLRLAKVATAPLATIARRLLGKVMEQWTVQQWELLRQQPERFDLLEEGALIVAQWAEPDEASVAAVRAGLASLADEVAQHTTPSATLRERIKAVNFVLFEQHGFAGNQNAYYDPRNSFIHTALSRKVGIPISLSIIWVAVARRLEIPCHLCPKMPRHIIVRVTTGQGIANDLFVDAFNCKLMDHSEMVRFTFQLVGFDLDEDWVVAGPPCLIYERLLRNLFGIYQNQVNEAAEANEAKTYFALQRLAGVCSQMATISDDGNEKSAFQSRYQTVIATLDKLSVGGGL